MADETPPPEPPKQTRSHKYAKGVREMLLTSLDELGGKDYLVTLAKTSPKAYAALLAKMIPQAVEVSGEDGAPIAIYFPPL